MNRRRRDRRPVGAPYNQMWLRKIFAHGSAFLCFLFLIVIFHPAEGAGFHKLEITDDETAWLKGIAESYGLLGVFLISAVSNLIPYSTVPYLFIIAIYAAAVDPVYRILVVILGGVGAAVGKVFVFYVGKLARRAISEQSKENLRIFVNLSRRSVALAVFIFAALPLPDDIIYLPLGMTGYSVLRFFAAVTMGKIVITFLATAFGASVGAIALGYPLWLVIIALGLLTFLLAFLILRINWLRVAEGAQTKGIWEGIRLLILEVDRMLRSLLRRSS